MIRRDIKKKIRCWINVWKEVIYMYKWCSLYAIMKINIPRLPKKSTHSSLFSRKRKRNYCSLFVYHQLEGLSSKRNWYIPLNIPVFQNKQLNMYMYNSPSVILEYSWMKNFGGEIRKVIIFLFYTKKLILFYFFV